MDTNALIAFLTEHQAAVPFIAAGLAAVETTAFLSVFVPSTALLVAVGAASSTGAVALGPIWVGATIGALVGSSFSYWLGWMFGARMLAAWPLRDHADGVARTKTLFARWGGLALVAGHFVGPLRPVVFLFAGLSRMRLWAFMAFNVVGAASWAYLIPKSGAVGGDILGWLWRALGF